jgi:thioredoxin 1
VSRVFDAPLVTSDRSWDRVLGAGLPVALVLHDGPIPPALEESMREIAAEHAGELLLVKAERSQNPEIKARYAIARGPAVVALRDGQVVSKGDSLTPGLLKAHVAYLLGEGPVPAASASRAHAGESTEPFVVTDEDFDRRVLQSGLPVMVDFWAPWCGPCRMVEPIVARLAREAKGVLQVAKLNVDDNPRTASRYGIRGIPSMIIFENGKIVDQWTGALPEPQMRARLSRWIGE